jgi:hypothetical protein
VVRTAAFVLAGFALGAVSVAGARSALFNLVLRRA